MDLNKLLSSVNNINDYISATEELQKCENLKIPLTMSTILNLKKNRSLEIEFFNKCEGNGIAFLVFERLLETPPSQKWHLLGKELVPMLHYWLEAVRKHLIIHNPRWWSFLATLLQFIKDIRSKDPSLTPLLLEQTTECLVDLACSSQMDELQRDEVLVCVNECSSNSSRELRVKMVDRINKYFVKLSTILAGCGHLPTQMGIMELLLRWLLRRGDPAVRADAACAWFPKHLFSSDTIALFLEASWREFYEDSRRFLNSHNGSREPQTVTSVLCCGLSVGRVVLFDTSSEAGCIWLDLNAGTRSITAYVDLCTLDSGGDANRRQLLKVTEDDTITVEMRRESGRIMLLIQMVQPPKLPLNEAQLTGDRCSLRARVIGDPKKLHVALRILFQDKYLNLASPRYRSGYTTVRDAQGPLAWNSPSSTSTTSLAQLRDKLTALPPAQYNKVTQKISITPDLPVVREVSEYEDITNTSRSRYCGVKYLSDSDTKSKPKKPKIRCISSAFKGKTASVILPATLGTTDESVVNDTFDKIYENNAEIDLVDLLAREALDNEQEKDSGIISGKKTPDTDVVENTPIENNVRHNKLTLKRRAKSANVTDESDADVIEDTPCYVYDRRKTVQMSTAKKVIESVIGDDEIITLGNDKFEEFFSQHVTEPNPSCLVASPTLAEIRNETRTEAHDDGIAVNIPTDDNVNVRLDIADLIVEENARCANSPYIASDINKTNNIVLNDTTKSTQDSKKITLKFQKPKSRKPARKMNKPKKSKREKEPNNVEETDVITENTSSNSPVNNKGAVLTRKKRKLYSPKDDDNDYEIPRAKTDKRQPMNCETPVAACYKELERSRLCRQTRASTEPFTSPKTKQLNDLFDKIKENVDNNEEITLVKKLRNKKDLAVYNLSSESDDSDFIKKKVQIQKRTSSSSLQASATKRGRTKNTAKPSYCDSISSSDGEVRRTKKKKVVKNTKPRSRKMRIEPNINLIDEKMRVATPEILETSFIRQTPDRHEFEEPDPALNQDPVMEMLPGHVNDIEADTTVTESRVVTPNQCQIKIKKEKGTKNTKTLVAKKDKTLNKKDVIEDVPREKDSATVSPLPGLVVESEQPRTDDLTSSMEANLLQKLKNIYTEVQDFNETDRTQNMLIAEDFNDDAAGVPDENIEILDMLSGKSIATCGKSPITGHNDLNELPPNVKSLDETIQHRNLDIEGMCEPLAEFLVNMRNKLNCKNAATISENKTSPGLPLTRTSTIERAMSINSNTSNPRVVLNRLSSDGIITDASQIATPKSAASIASNTSNRNSRVVRLPSAEIGTTPNPVTPRSNASSARVVLSRITSEEIERYSSTPKTPKTTSSKSVSVVLERISTDEIDRWLPMPQWKDTQELPKKYITRQATSKPTGVTKTSNKVGDRTIKGAISPVKLNFDISEMTRSINLRPYQTRSSTRSIMFLENIDKDNDDDIIDSQKTGETNDVPDISQKSTAKSSAVTRHKIRTDRIPASFGEALHVNVTPPEINESVTSVNEWFNKNASAPPSADNVATKEVLQKVLEVLDTTLAEIHQSTGDKLMKAFVVFQTDLNSFKEDMLSRIQELQNKQQALACEILSSDAEKKAELVNMLKEDIKSVLDLINKENK